MNILESIKHKGKRIDNGEWVYGFYANGLIDLDGDKEIYRHFIIVWDINGYFTDYVVDPETVCHDDVILQRLERYETALKKISVPVPGSRDNELVLYYERIAKEALRE